MKKMLSESILLSTRGKVNSSVNTWVEAVLGNKGMWLDQS